MIPATPKTAKVHRQPTFTTIAKIMGAPMMEEILAPLLNREVAKARSLTGNHSDTDLIAAGKFPDAARPNTARQAARQTPE